MVSEGLQNADNTLYNARYALNFIGHNHPAILSKVGSNFADHQWRSFESGIVEVQAKQEGLLNEAEKIALALEPFLSDPQIIDIPVQLMK
jgi:hypothetical protein